MANEKETKESVEEKSEEKSEDQQVMKVLPKDLHWLGEISPNEEPESMFYILKWNETKIDQFNRLRDVSLLILRRKKMFGRVFLYFLGVFLQFKKKNFFLEIYKMIISSSL